MFLIKLSIYAVLHSLLFFLAVFLPPPQWGAADAEIKVPSGENTELKRSPFQAWSMSVYSHACYAYCEGVLPSDRRAGKHHHILQNKGRPYAYVLCSCHPRLRKVLWAVCFVGTRSESSSLVDFKVHMLLDRNGITTVYASNLILRSLERLRLDACCLSISRLTQGFLFAARFIKFYLLPIRCGFNHFYGMMKVSILLLMNCCAEARDAMPVIVLDSPRF